MTRNELSLSRRILKRATKLQDCSDAELREMGLSLKYQAMTGAKPIKLIPQSFALVAESARRSVDMVPYVVQVFGGIQIALGRIAEMKTGEGKTLTATMPTFLHALAERGAHVVTVNDYLAQRDFETMGPIYERLGLSVGVITADDTPEKRKIAYRKDITYGTAKEFGFDFLRDRLRSNGSSSRLVNKSENVMRDLHYVLVDEADSVLIDEARTPLIIGITDPEEEKKRRDCFNWAAQHAKRFIEEVDYKYEHDTKKVELSRMGTEKARRIPQNASTRLIPIRKLFEYLENAIKVQRDFQLDKQYVVRDGKIAIVDEFTGRIAEGRQWQGGIHQSVEAKEKLEITPATRQGATITMQTFFRRYASFGGMSGTVRTSKSEFKKVYKKSVIRIPTHRPIDRTQLSTKVFRDFESKLAAIVAETKALANSGRSVLVGTRSVETSEQLSAALTTVNVEHLVLNANQDRDEASIVAQAGRQGRVTVATNMAGRGTDIMLEDSVRNSGGLHVILSELHESQRIDWQLIGRCSRQGDPGSFRIFVSLEDELLLKGLGPKKFQTLVKRFASTGASSPTEPISSSLFKYFLDAQNKLQKTHLVDRLILLKQDEERQKRHFEMGLDPFCDVVQS